MRFSEKFVRSLVIKDDNPKSTPNRVKIGETEGWVSIVVNFVLFVVKLVFSLITGSLALTADAFHTLSDVVTSFVIIIGFRISNKPADWEHPFGHGRAETITTLTVALLIGLVGFEFLKSGIMRLIHPEVFRAGWLAISAVVLTIVAKEWLSRFSYQLGDLIDSDTLRGDALHHRSDAISSIFVIIALVGSRYSLNYLDGLMSIGVAGFMCFAGYDLARTAIDDLLGKPISRETVDRIREISLSVTGVLNVHDVVVHSYGSSIFISLHIEVPDTLSPGEIHTISDKVEHQITRDMEAEVVTHVDPVTSDGEMIQKIKKLMKSMCKEKDLKFRIQDLRVVGHPDPEAILFELPVPFGDERMPALKDDYTRMLRGHFPGADIKIDLKQQISQE